MLDSMRIFNRKQKQRLSIDELKSQLNVKKETSSKLQLPKSPASALLKLSDEEKKQVVAWLDLERNAEILQKTDKAIAAKLNVKTADLTLGPGTGLSIPGSGRVKSAAQVLADGDITDEEIDAILDGIDEGLNDDGILFEDPTILSVGRCK